MLDIGAHWCIWGSFLAPQWSQEPETVCTPVCVGIPGYRAGHRGRRGPAGYLFQAGQRKVLSILALFLVLYGMARWWPAVGDRVLGR